MAKRTHKLRAIGDIDAIVRHAPSLSAAAKQLGVNRSTLHRWIADGKVGRKGPILGQKVDVPAHQSPEAWAAAVRDGATLSATAQQLIDASVMALTMARDGTLPPAVRLSAMGRFQALVKDLNLETDESARAVPRPAARTMPSRTGMADPRAVLMAVK